MPDLKRTSSGLEPRIWRAFLACQRCLLRSWDPAPVLQILLDSGGFLALRFRPGGVEVGQLEALERLRRREQAPDLLYCEAGAAHLEAALAAELVGLEELEELLRQLARDLSLKPPSPHLETLLQTLPDLVWMKDQDGVFLACNRRFEELLGATREEILGKTDYDFVPAEIADFFRRNDLRALKAGAPQSNEEWVTFQSDGHRELLETIKAPVYAPDGQVIGILGIGRDITERWRGAQKLIESEERLRTFVEHAPASVAMFDQNMVYLAASRRYLQDYRIEQTDLQGRSHYEIFPEMPERWREIHRRCLAGEVERCEEEAFPRLDGQVDWLRWELRPWWQSDGRIGGVILFSEVITERKNSELALRQSEERFHQGLDTMPLPVGVLDEHEEFIYLNPAFTETFGFTLSETQDFPGLLERVLAEGAADWLKVLREDVRRARGCNRSTTPRVLRFLCKDGTTRDVELMRRQVGPVQVAVFQDVSERLRAQAALLEAEERGRLALEAACQGTFRHDLRSDLVELDLRAMQHFGLRSTPVFFSELLSRCHPEDRPRLDAILEHLPGATPEGRTSIEHRVIWPSGEVRTLRVHGQMVFSEPGVPRYGIGTTLDVTEARQAEETLRQQQEKMQAAQRLEAIGRLAGGVAHDFNNLLTVILSCAELSVAGLHEQDPMVDDLREIIDSAHRAERLTRQLLAFSRRQVLNLECIDFGALLSEVSRMLRRLIGEDIALELELPAETLLVRADSGQLEQVLLNLAVNARDAMPAGGRLRLAASAETVGPALAEALEVAPGEYVLLVVSDSGSGMDEATRARVFEPFFTTKAVGKGTGLGLSTVYGIVRQSEGAIRVESQAGLGCTFRIYLPRQNQQSPPATADKASSLSAGGPETLLVVEDELPVRKVVERALTGAGYRVLVAGDGLQAMKMAELHGQEVSLILTDVVMPGMNGREFSLQVAGLCPRARILFMSGYTDDVLARHELEGFHFLPKPFDLKTLAQRVRSVLDEPRP